MVEYKGAIGFRQHGFAVLFYLKFASPIIALYTIAHKIKEPLMRINIYDVVFSCEAVRSEGDSPQPIVI
jgi:hypothetical protein